jgi:hypothetical protein
MANSGTTKAAANSSEKNVVGTYIAYKPDGSELWKKENFIIGEDKVPSGVSMGMAAGRIIDAKTGEQLKRWNPWGVL